jgi:hypothetical protein
VASHQSHPRRPASREPPAGSLRPSAPWEPPTEPLRPPTMLRSSTTGPCHSKPHERPPIGVGRAKCLANKNNDKIYQMKQ